MSIFSYHLSIHWHFKVMQNTFKIKQACLRVSYKLFSFLNFGWNRLPNPDEVHSQYHMLFEFHKDSNANKNICDIYPSAIIALNTEGDFLKSDFFFFFYIFDLYRWGRRTTLNNNTLRADAEEFLCLTIG